MKEARIMALQRAVTAAERFCRRAQEEIVALRGDDALRGEAAERSRAADDLTAALLGVREVELTRNSR